MGLISRVSSRTYRESTGMATQVEQLQHELEKREEKISMLQSELESAETRYDEYEDKIGTLEEALRKSLLRKPSPRKPLILKNTGEADTRALLDDTDLTINDSTSTEFIEDSISSTPFKLVGDRYTFNTLKDDPSNKENRSAGGFDTFIEKVEAKERLTEENNLLTEVNQQQELIIKELTDERDELKNCFEELMTDNDALKAEYSDKVSELESARLETEQIQNDLIRSNNKVNDLGQVEKEKQDLCEKLENLEMNYVKEKDQVKQGINLFAEVEGRKEYVEKIA